jgi:hypothetical protein
MEGGNMKVSDVNKNKLNEEISLKLYNYSCHMDLSMTTSRLEIPNRFENNNIKYDNHDDHSYSEPESHRVFVSMYKKAIAARANDPVDACNPELTQEAASIAKQMLKHNV